MNISFSNCNNIESGSIEIVESKLNIKYGINGTGKSTVARAIRLYLDGKTKGKQDLSELLPFKSATVKGLVPAITGIETINTIKVFDEQYVNAFLFQADELVKGSFDIFMRDDEYERSVQAINEIVKSLQDALAKDPEIADLLRDFSEIVTCFGKETKDGGFHGASEMAKTFKGGNRVEHIPVGLEGYATFIKSPSNSKWIEWQIDGKTYLNQTDSCPYCTSDIAQKKSVINKVGEVYDPKAVKNLNKILGVFDRLGKYFSESTKVKVREFVTSESGYNKDQEHYVSEIRNQIIALSKRFEEARNIGFQSLKGAEKTKNILVEMKIDLSTYSHLQSEATEAKVKVVNDSIDKMLDQAGILQGKVNIHKSKIESLVREYGAEINSFLANAGYKYKAELVPDKTDQHKLKLKHVDMDMEVSNPKGHLSFGERNAFALVLFMFEAVKSAPDLIVLDDPISSFDKNKKFAIMEMLFARSGRSFRNKTVLMLTHDLDPVIDLIYHHSRNYEKTSAHFLFNNHGTLGEKQIERTDILTFYEMNLANSCDSTISSLVYLRRNCEALGDKGLVYNYLSCLLHRKTLTNRTASGETAMTPTEIQEAINGVKKHIATYDHDAMWATIKDDSKLKQIYAASASNYEKLHIYRIYHSDKAMDEPRTIKKFINESFHIENDYIYQLNPKDFQTVPQYVIEECDKLMLVPGGSTT